MEFGVFNGVFVPAFLEDPDAEHKRIMHETRIILRADELGFKYHWAAEHHFLTEYSHLSDNPSWLGYLAGKTSYIHLGSGIFNVSPPVNAPARIAERVAMLDHLSEGRFEFGAGRGSSSRELGGFGIDDMAITKEMFDEVMPEFKKMWRQGSYSFDGQFFSMPPRNVLPKPYSKPHPPMWVACGSPSTFEKAGRLGLGALAFSLGEPSTLAPYVETYKRAIQDAEPVGAYVNDNISLVTTGICLKDGDKARDYASNMGYGYFASVIMHCLDNIPFGDSPRWPTILPDPTPEDLKEVSSLVAGNPDEFAAKCKKYEEAGADQLLFGTNFLLPDEVWYEHLETMAEEVIPRFDEDRVHRTTAQRRSAWEKLKDTYVQERAEEPCSKTHISFRSG